MIYYNEKGEFPTEIINKLKQLHLVKEYLSKPYGKGHNVNKFCAIVLELSWCDASLATFVLVQTILFLHTVDLKGSDYIK